MVKKYKPTKSKTIAILLAVFLGQLAWAYTWKYDAWKFFVNFFLVIISFGLWALFAWIWSIVDMSVKPKELFEEYYG